MSAVQQAVDLLREARAQAEAAVSKLQESMQEQVGEIKRIDQALTSLGEPLTRPGRSASEDLGGLAELDTQPVTVTQAVREVLESKYGPWSPSKVREILVDHAVAENRSSEQLIGAVRTAFHSLRAQKIARQVAPGQTVAAKWAKDAEAPVVAGASDGDGSSEDPSRKEGGTVNGAAHPGRDAGAVGAAPHHGLGDRASIEEAPSR